MNISGDDPNDEPTEEEVAAHELQVYLQGKADAFDKLCNERHEEGATRYGALTFLENDVLRMMLEELADTANYCRMQGIKLLLLQDRLEAQLGEERGFEAGEDGSIQLGFQSFMGTKKAGWVKP